MEKYKVYGTYEQKETWGKRKWNSNPTTKLTK